MCIRDRHTMDRRCLPTSVGPQQAEYFPVLNLQRKVVQRDQFPIPLHQIVHLNHCFSLISYLIHSFYQPSSSAASGVCHEFSMTNVTKSDYR